MSMNKTMNDPLFFQTDLINYVVRRVKDRSVAQDIVHDVFLKAQSRAGQVREQEKWQGWIYRIARNTIIDHFRAQSKNINAADLDWESDERYLNQCVEQCLSEMLGTLPHKYREALELSDLQGVSQLELAKQLKISYSGAKSRVQRARQMLRQRMEEEYHIQLDQYGNVTRCENRVPCECENK